MTATRRLVLAGLVVALAALAGAILFEVLATAFFAVTVAYLLAPVHRRLTARGVSPWWASLATTAAATAAVVVPTAVGVYFATDRVDAVVAFVRSLPASVALEVFGVTVVVEAATVLAAVQEFLSAAAVAVASELPVVALKLSVFAVLVFGVLMGRRRAGRAMLAAIPPAYRDLAYALHDRARDTLFAIYVLQAATAVATAAVAFPLFLALGYPIAGTLAVVAGVLQFLPIVGPSILVVGLAAYEAAAGDVTGAVLVGVLGSVFVAWLPDVLVRPRLARETARLPGSLYFVGFVGGLLTIGPVGIIAGPLVVALLLEATELLAEEVNHRSQRERRAE